MTDENVTLGKMNYSTAVCFLWTWYLILLTLSTHCVHNVSSFAYQTNWRNEIWNTSWLQTYQQKYTF